MLSRHHVAPELLGDALAGLHAHPPLVQCLTNVVAAQWTANILLAVGASPAMVDNPDEAGGFAAVAGGVLINLGTPQHDTAAAMAQAATGAAAAGTPWVLDPVGAGGLPWRTRVALDLLSRSAPAIIRGNASEILGLSGGEGGKGVDSEHTAEAALGAAAELAREHGSVVAVSGAVDHLTDGRRVVRVANGTELLTRVTGTGCALGALMAGFCAVVEDPLLAATAATATLTVAAEEAAGRSRGPGGFAVALLDELALITPAVLAERTRLS
ncbi:hydroxyethylthiazole kinase [Georgenia ruanii]|uniref:Hydroxyethylthiazole kinase n=2 Tax=Georgenia ruanii TaxID=348442 RepID=A0A7J9UTY2_9MICO|nr:hydroxyethylthiazole kinase [Georgenia ruanii]